MLQLQQYFGFSEDECMAFGDNYNDIDMLKSVKYAYVMDTACEDIKKYAYDTTEWVEGTLRKEFNI